MRKSICALIAAFLILPCALAAADYGREDLLSVMLRAAACGDIEAGRAAARCRNAEISRTRSSEVQIDFDELYLLARVIYSEAGSDKLDNDLRRCVGEVVLNRIDSPEFPNTLYEVIYEPGQYDEVCTPEFKYYTYPSRECAEIAAALLSGEREMPPSVVFQANFRQGGGVCRSFVSKDYGLTYFCYSTRPELYPAAGA